MVTRFGFSQLSRNLVIVFFVSHFFLSCATAPAEKSLDMLCETRERVPSMGTFFEISLVTSCSSLPKTDVFLSVQKVLDQIEAELSTYQLQSPLSRLNKQGYVDGNYPHLIKLLNVSLIESPKLENTFNIAVLPILRLIEKSFREQQAPPKKKELEGLRPLLDLTAVQQEPGRISLSKPGMQLTFDGIAKGYAVDEVASLFSRMGYTDFLLNFSGNMKWQGRRADLQDWKIHLWNPVTQKSSAMISPGSFAVASSGPENNHWDKSHRWHHLIDPKSLQPALLWSQTTVVGLTAMECDLLSTATFMMPVKKIRELMKAHYPHVHVWGIDLAGKMQKIYPTAE